MSKYPLRALVGLALALALAAVAAPPSGADRADGTQVSTAAVAPPVIFSLVDEVAVPPTPGEVLAAAGDHVAQSVAAAQKQEQAPAPQPEPPAAPAPPPPAPAGSIQAIIQRHFGAAADQAIRIATCESKLNPAAVSATGDYGLFQIHESAHRAQFEAVTGHPWADVFDPEINTIYAKWIYDRQGWSPWSCRSVL